MNPEEIIESVYDVDSVEGAALFSPDAVLLENQLSISEAAVLQIGQILLQMKSDLASAERLLKGLLLGSEKQAFLVYLYGDHLLLLQLNDMTKTNESYTRLKSVLGEPPAEAFQSNPVSLPPLQQQVVEELPVEEPVAVQGLSLIHI